MLTIGELASHAGVTVRAVRHYHAKGLLRAEIRERQRHRERIVRLDRTQAGRPVG